MPVRMSVRRGPRQIALAPGEACPVCGQSRAAGRTLCTDCCRDVSRMLDPAWTGDVDERLPASIPVLWSQLDPALATRDPRDRRAPGFRSSAPLSLDVVVLRDPRSRPDSVVPVWYPPLPDGRDDWSRPLREQDGAPRAVGTVIEALASSVWESLELAGPLLPGGRVAGRRGVAACCAWLLARVDEVTALPHAGDVHADLGSLVADLRGPAGDPPDRPIGPCVGLISVPGRHDRVPCREPLYVPPPRPGRTVAAGEPLFSCSRCGRPYTALDVLRARISAEQDT